MKKLFLTFLILLFATNAFPAVFPKEMSNKKIFVMAGNDARYSSLWTLGQFVHFLNEGTIEGNGRLKISNSPSSYSIEIISANTNVTMRINAQNVLTELVIKRGIERFTYDSSKHKEMVQSLMFLLPFTDKVEKKAELQKRNAAEKEAVFVRDNMLNFEYHMPLFAGLAWGDEFADGIKKLKKVNGITGISADCHLDEKVFGRDPELLAIQDAMTGKNDSPTKKIEDILNKEDLSTISDDEAKTVNDNVEGCTVRGKIVLFNTPSEIVLEFGKTSYGGQVPYYLNHVRVSGEFGPNLPKLLETYKAKYKDYKVHDMIESERVDRFGSYVNFGAHYGEADSIEYNKSNDISDLQMKILSDEEMRNKSDEYKDAPQADGAI
ncbi:hypothetical protein [Geomonas subterranea]|uniref:hypothetical protein n=1 Tax=Geomonas subterranea TaxID=2847989 RepID=UPI001CD3B465|nr:hypothetical protein [Geomonas fuzhouensis]